MTDLAVRTQVRIRYRDRCRISSISIVSVDSSAISSIEIFSLSEVAGSTTRHVTRDKRQKPFQSRVGLWLRKLRFGMVEFKTIRRGWFKYPSVVRRLIWAAAAAGMKAASLFRTKREHQIMSAAPQAVPPAKGDLELAAQLAVVTGARRSSRCL
jgi:hypothetical protein